MKNLTKTPKTGICMLNDCCAMLCSTIVLLIELVNELS